MNHLPENLTKSRLSEAGFFAMGSFSRYKLTKVPQEDDSGTDYRLVQLILRDGKPRDNGIVLEFQMKSTENWEESGDSIKYALENKTYNDVVQRNIHGTTPLVVVLLCLPQGDPSWLVSNGDGVLIKEKFYWYHTEDKTLLPNEDSKKVITIPKSNRLTSESFQTMVKNHAIQVQR